jgi:peptidyl-prolyl cis-trans isomerase C
LKRWLGEPMLHFLLAGCALFAVYRALNPGPDNWGRSSRIEITEDDVRQLDVAWMAQWRRHPTGEELRALIDGKVREEILYREALALGLDKDDTIVTRRLAQKMEFLAEDISGLREPGSEELKAWFEKNRERYALPGRVSFRHLYFSRDSRGERAREAAARTLERLAGRPVDSPLATKAGDRFMFQDYYGDSILEQVAGVFGTQFAQALFQLKSGSWQGPLESGLGWHLVFVDSITPGRVPAFEEVEADVKTGWIDEQRAAAKRRAFDAMRGRYEVVLPGISATPPRPAP